MASRFIRTAACVMVVWSALVGSAFGQSDWVEKVGAELLAKHLNLDLGTVLNHRQGSIFDDAPAFVIQRHTRKDFDDIWSLRRQGLGWGEIAHRLGMHPGTFNKMRKNGDFDNDRIWSRAVDSRFNLTDRELRFLNQSGMSWHDRVATCHTARDRRVAVDRVVTEWRRDRNWDRVKQRFTNRRADDDHQKGKGKSSSHGKSKGKGKGKGKGGKG